MSLYLSRLILNPRSRQVWSELAHPYEMHRTLMRAFPQLPAEDSANARERCGVLFRAEEDESQHRVIVYVQSRVEPDWTFLQNIDGYLLAGSPVPSLSCKDIMPAYQKLSRGQVLTFRLRANPTKRVARDGDPMKGKRVELQREEEQIAWLMQKGAGRGGMAGGFELATKRIQSDEGGVVSVPCVDVCRIGKQTSRRKTGASLHQMTHLAVVFEGQLRVTDATVFRESLIRGMGSGKAFGFGLLSVARASTSTGRS